MDGFRAHQARGARTHPQVRVVVLKLVFDPVATFAKGFCHELMSKMLDARPVNGHFWFFSGSLTDVERTITVTDTKTGRAQTYHRASGDSTGQIDVTAF